MESKIIYELSQQDLNKAIADTLADLNKRSVLERFRDRLVSPRTVAEIHGVTPETVIKYANARLIPGERQGKLYKFSLAEVLQIDFHQLRRIS